MSPEQSLRCLTMVLVNYIRRLASWPLIGKTILNARKQGVDRHDAQLLRTAGLKALL